MNRLIGIVLATLVALAGLSVLFGTWYRVEGGERAVILRNGSQVGIAEPGLRFKLPLIDRVERMSLRARLETFPEMKVYTRDGRPATMRLSVSLRAVPERLADLQAGYGTLDGAVERAVRPRIEHESRVVVAAFPAAAAIRERRRLSGEIEQAIRAVLPDAFRLGSVQIENLAFAPEAEQGIARGLAAEGGAAGCEAPR